MEEEADKPLKRKATKAAELSKGDKSSKKDSKKKKDQDAYKQKLPRKSAAYHAAIRQAKSEGLTP